MEKKDIVIGDRVVYTCKPSLVYTIAGINLENESSQILYTWVDNNGILKKFECYTYLELMDDIDKGVVILVGEPLSPIRQLNSFKLVRE